MEHVGWLNRIDWDDMSYINDEGVKRWINTPTFKTRYYGETPFNKLYDKPELTAYDQMLIRKAQMYPKKEFYGVQNK